MGWLSDLFKEIPLSVIQQQKIAQLEAQYAAMEAEKASLKDDIRQAKAEITKLKKQVEEFTHKDSEDLDGFDINILQLIAVYTNALPELIAEDLKAHPEKLTLHLNDLSKRGYIRAQNDSRGFLTFRLCDKARRFLIDNDLLPPPPSY